jgi:hypothetical protein
METIEFDGEQFVTPDGVRFAIKAGNIEALEALGRWLIPLAVAEAW